MLIFNKQFRTEEKTISALIKKIDKSGTIVRSYVGNTEKYEFDTFDVSFVMNPGDKRIVVVDKIGNEILSMDCNYDPYDEMQEARSIWFSQTLENARRRYGKEQATKALKNAAKFAAKAFGLKSKKKSQQDAAMNALNRVRNL